MFYSRLGITFFCNEVWISHGGKANKEKDDKPRARQNVVLETGFFMGKLGRERLVIIAENGIELPSDMQGVVYINNHWEFDMLKELQNMGFDIDMNKLS